MAASQNTKKTVFVITPGSFARPTLYYQLRDEILSAGYDAHVLPLLSVDDDTGRPPASMEEDAAHIRSSIVGHLDHETTPKDVVLVTHSYSGVPGNCALEGLGKTDRSAQNKETAVVGFISMASYLPLKGETIRSICASFGVTLPEPLKSGVPGDYMPVNHDVVAGAVFNDVSDPAFIKEQASHFAAHGSDSYDGKVTHEAWREIPALSIIPENDLLMPLSLHEGMFERAVAVDSRVRRSLIKGAGHGLNATRTKEVVEEMLRFLETLE